MKKVLTLLLCFVLLLSLCACGGKSANDVPESNAPVSGENTPTGENTPVDEPDPSEGIPEDPSEEIQDMVELVKSYIDKPIEDLYAVIGEPESSDYAPSCLGDGEDGMLIYDGFIVYTYREGDSEIVFDVE